MSLATASLKYIFGLRKDVAKNVAFLDEQTVVYPSGSNCVLYNLDQKSQKFIQGSDRSREMTAMAMSSNRRYIAVAEKGNKERGDKVSVTIYDLTTQRKRKVLNIADINSDELVSLAFSPDSKYLACQCGAPDWNLTYWSWEKSRLLASVKVSAGQGSFSINQITFNPSDNTQLCVVGQSLFKLYRHSEGNLKQSAFQKVEAQNYLSHAWVSDERIIVGTETGRLFLFDSGELKAELRFGESSRWRRDSADGRERSVAESSETESLILFTGTRSITAIVAFTKGFACACGPGLVVVFEKSDEKEFYRKQREILIQNDDGSAVDAASMQKLIITNLTISPSEELLVCTTASGQMYSFALSTSDLKSKNDLGQFETLSQSFHTSTITGLDVCYRKPLVATCSIDRSIRLWNFETCSLELCREFSEDIYSIAIHPSGLYILVGFSDKLRLMNLLIDDIRTFKEFGIRGCRECCFSNGGQYFAAANGPLMQIYSTVTLENVATLKGHNGKVNCMKWSADDTQLVSCGGDGAVYEWDVASVRRTGENVIKSCVYTSVTLSPDAKTIYAVGSDSTIKEISDSQLLRTVDCGATLTSVVLSNSGRMLFAGTSSGAIRSIKFPLTTPGEWNEGQGHSAAITKLIVTPDDQCLVSVAEDATVIIWKIQDREGRGLKRDIVHAEEILITKTDLEEKNAMMAELKTRVEELKSENDYQQRLKDMNYNDKIKELTEKFIQEMESLKTKNQVLKNEKEKTDMRHSEELDEIRERLNRERQELESTNNQKLMIEYEKYQELQSKSQRMQEEYEHQLNEKDELRKFALAELTERHELKIAEIMTKLDQVKDESKQRYYEHEETKRQIEEDADIEILGLRTRLEQKIRDEQDANQKLRGETGIMKKKFSSQQKDIEGHKEEIKKNQNEITKLNNLIRNLEKDIVGLKKEIQERDETIQDKERRIYDLKKKNQELEKFKFVLDYKIKELKKQIEPREEDIRQMKDQIQEMESELERFHKQNSQLELNIEELRQKLKSTEKEMHQEQQRVVEVNAAVRRFKTDLHNCVGYIQDPKMLSKSVKMLYQKHVHEDITETAGLDADIQREYGRQREHLEKTVASLRKKLVKDADIHRADNVRVMQENVSLIKEINDLRRELKASRSRLHDLESVLGLNRQGNQTTAASITQLSTATSKNPWLERELDEKNKVIELQQSEIQKLRNAVELFEKKPEPRVPGSVGNRLPPVAVS